MSWFVPCHNRVAHHIFSHIPWCQNGKWEYPPPLVRRWQTRGWRLFGSTLPDVTTVCISTFLRGRFLHFRGGVEADMIPDIYHLVVTGGHTIQ